MNDSSFKIGILHDSYLVLKCSYQKITTFFLIGGLYMDKQEIMRCYCIEDKLLNKYLDSGLIEDKFNYTDDDIKKISMAMSLEKIGLTLSSICQYLSLNDDKKKNTNQLLSILSNQRKIILNKIHMEEDKISALDYYIYKLRKQQQ